MKFDLVKKVVIKEIDGEEKTYVNYFLRNECLDFDIQIKAAFPKSDTSVLKKLATKVDD